MKLENIFQQLVKQGLCSSGLQFSEQYLGKYKSYYSVIKATKTQSSTKVLINLDFSLQRKIAQLKEESDPDLCSQINVLFDIQKQVHKAIKLRCQLDFDNHQLTLA